MRGDGKPKKVVVKFDARIAPLIKEVEWHPSQQIEDLPDGDILYTATVPETTEVRIWILSYGHHAEVIAPESLRAEVAAVAEKMHQRYQKD